MRPSTPPPRRRSILPSFRALRALLAAVLAATVPLGAQTTRTWTGPNPGEWSIAGNWSSGVVPNGNQDTAIFSNTSATPANLSVGLSGSPFTVRGLRASNTSPYGLVVLGSLGNPAAQSLTFSDATGGIPTIDVSSGTLELSASLNAGAHFSKTGAGALLLTGPATSTQITLDGGRLHLSGANTVETLAYKIAPTAFTSSNTSLSTGLHFWGAGVVQTSTSLALSLGNNTFVNDTITAEVDLGGLYRKFKGVSLATIASITGRTDNSVVIDIRNGALETGSFNCDLSLPGSGNRLELHLPESSTITGGSLTVGAASGSSAQKLSAGRLRVGTEATLRIDRLSIGYNGSSGRIDALAPGSTLTLSGRLSTRLPSLDIGNISFPTPAGYDSGIDMETGTLNLFAGNVTIRGASTLSAPAVASIRFGAGTVDITSLALGDAPPSAFDHQCLVVQKGGDAKIQGLTLALSGNSTAADRRTYQYQFHAGTLSLGNVTGPGNSTVKGVVRRGIEWTSGTIKNYPGRSAAISTTPASPIISPLDLSVLGSGTHLLDIEPNQTFTLGPGGRLTSDSTAATLTKTGDGALVLAGDSTAFTGFLRLDAGTLSLGATNAVGEVPLGSLVWNAGTLAFDLSTTDSSSDRLVLARSLSKGSSPASARVIDLKSVLATGTYTLATFASTDLTRDDFTVAGLAPGYVADFTVGPTALTVSYGPYGGYTKWRIAFLASYTNLGAADDDADPDGDGRPNLLEYALGSVPLAADSGPPVTVAAEPATGHLTLTFTRINDPALTYTVLAADNPAGPWSGEGSEIVFTSTGSANLDGPVAVTDSVPLSAHPRRFMRLAVSR